MDELAARRLQRAPPTAPDTVLQVGEGKAIYVLADGSVVVATEDPPAWLTALLQDDSLADYHEQCRERKRAKKHQQQKNKVRPPGFGQSGEAKRWRNKRARVYKRDGEACVKCGSTEDLTLDHIRPKAYGGSDLDANLQTLCDGCNIKKAGHWDGRSGHSRSK